MSAVVPEVAPADVPTRTRRLVHGLCETCYPRGVVQPGRVVVALCGDVDSFDRWTNATDSVADECLICVEIGNTPRMPARSCNHFDS